MRYFHRLPPLLQVACILGLLFPLASTAVVIEAIIALISSLSSFPHWSADSSRLLVIGLNLGMLSGSCSFAVNTYSLRFRRPRGGTFPLESWQSQVRAIALLAALPLCALAMTLLLPPGSLAFFFPIGITLLAALVMLAAYVWLTAFGAASGRPTSTPGIR